MNGPLVRHIIASHEDGAVALQRSQRKVGGPQFHVGDIRGGGRSKNLWGPTVIDCIFTFKLKSFCFSFLFRLNLDLGGYGGLWFPCPPPASGAPGRHQRRPRKQQRGRTRRRIRSWRVNLLFYPMINEARPSYLAATYSTQWCILYFFCPIWCHVLWFVASNQWIIAPNKKKNIW